MDITHYKATNNINYGFYTCRRQIFYINCRFVFYYINNDLLHQSSSIYLKPISISSSIYYFCLTISIDTSLVVYDVIDVPQGDSSWPGEAGQEVLLVVHPWICARWKAAVEAPAKLLVHSTLKD